MYLWSHVFDITGNPTKEPEKCFIAFFRDCQYLTTGKYNVFKIGVFEMKDGVHTHILTHIHINMFIYIRILLSLLLVYYYWKSFFTRRFFTGVWLTASPLVSSGRSYWCCSMDGLHQFSCFQPSSPVSVAILWWLNLAL